MTLSISPPPLQIPPEFGADKLKSAFFSSLINTIYQMWVNLYGIRASYKVTTEDASLTSAIRTPIDAGKTMMIQAHVVARRTGGSSGTDGDSAFYVITGAYKNIGGSLSGIGSVDLIAGEDQASWNVGFSASGSSAILTVQGAANNNITWECTISTYLVGA